MQIFTLLFIPPLLLASAQNPTGCINATTPQYRIRRPIADVMKDWGKLWKGDFSVLNDTVMPDVAIYQDLLPAPSDALLNGSSKTIQVAKPVRVTNAEELTGFMAASKKGFASYSFKNQFYFTNKEGTMLATRWALEAMVGNDTTSPIRNPGDLVQMNGTDIISFHCSGRIQSVATAQDLLGYLQTMGIDIDLPDRKACQ